MKESFDRSYQAIFLMCAGHGTNSAGDKPTTGIYRKCNELQVVVSDGKDGGSGVVILLSVRTET